MPAMWSGPRLAREILVVEGDVCARDLLVEALASAERVITAVPCAEDAIDLLDQKRYDAVLMSLDLPGMDGLTALRLIKRCWPAVPVGMLTGHTNALAEQSAMMAGAQLVTSEEASPADLSAIVDHLVAFQRTSLPASESGSEPIGLMWLDAVVWTTGLVGSVALVFWLGHRWFWLMLLGAVVISLCSARIARSMHARWRRGHDQ